MNRRRFLTTLSVVIGPAAVFGMAGCGMEVHENEKGFADTKGFISPDAAESAQEYERKLRLKRRKIQSP